MNAPEGAIVDAIWRCKRGHESAAAWHSDEIVISNNFPLSIVLEVGGKPCNICLQCLVDDYGTERVEFKDG